jgi:hypothetical protein
MPESSAPGSFEPPSRKRILVSTAIALLVAVIVLVTIVWPAEYGRDPLGIGGLLGITGMSAGQTETITLVDNIGGNEVLREVEIPAFGDPVPLPNPAVYQQGQAAPQTRTMTVELDVDGQTEVKTVLEENQVITYHWSTDGGLVYSQFHGHTPEFGDEFWVEYLEIEQGATEESGSLVAPFSGEHGWFWLNLSDDPVTITLTVTGYFQDMIDYSDLF